MNQKKVLVIDDDEVARMLISGILQTDPQYTVLTEESTQEGLTRTFQENPDLIILDIMMPEIDGYQACRILRSDITTRYIPIIVVSAKSSVDSRIEALKLGVDDYITKPFNHTELVARIEALLRRSELNLDANPLTRLPGNISIERELVKRIADNREFAVGFSDLDNFKAFNDKYGFARGDRVIFDTGYIIKDAVTRSDFVGHIGGDDFVFITTPQKVVAICQTIIKRFDEEIPTYYDEKSRARGYITGITRTGEVKQFPLMTISIAVVTNLDRNFKHFAEISEIGAELKQYLKTLDGSNYLIDRRKPSNDCNR